MQCQCQKWSRWPLRLWLLCLSLGTYGRADGVRSTSARVGTGLLRLRCLRLSVSTLHLHRKRRSASARGSVRYSWNIWCLAPAFEHITPAPAVHVTPAPWYTIYSCASGATPVIVYMTPASAVYAAPVTVVESMLLWQWYPPGQAWQ